MFNIFNFFNFFNFFNSEDKENYPGEHSDQNVQMKCRLISPYLKILLL
jgi:hypothetical protein